MTAKATTGATLPVKTGLREQRKTETRDRIVQAAVACFAELGFDGASTRDIARAAGVGQGLVTYHFESKDALWRAAVVRAFEHFPEPQEVVPVDGSESPAQLKTLFLELAHLYANHCVDAPFVAMLIYHQAGQRDERLQWLIETQFIPNIEKLRPLYQAGTDAGVIRPIPFVTFAFAFTGVINTHFALYEVYRRVSGDDPREPAIADAILQSIGAMFLLDDN
ncbi:TetR/AcrR family transcriptional regulator [Exilibacterium tricleocarpae]|nr:TetR/AcrR family transcriptional regulator [Exilibacterium tricleocarpae]